MEESDRSVGTPRERHVGIFTSSLRGGGAERVITTLANEFAARGVRTDLLLARAEGPYLTKVDPVVRLVDFGVRRPMFAVGALAGYLRRERPSALLSALTHSNLVAVAARVLSRAPVRHVVSQRNDASIRPYLFKEAKELPNFWLLGPGYRRSDGVIAVSKGVAESLVRHHGIPPDLIDVVYNPVVIPAPAFDSEAPHPWMATKEPPVILGAGEFIPQKGFDTLVEAFYAVRQERPVRLVILGEGKLRPELEQLVGRMGLEDDVLLPGFVMDPWSWMRYAAVFTLSSRWEGLPGVLLEAMACGTPVVSTDCPSGPSEILEDGKWGRLVSVDDSAEIARAILATLDDDTHPAVVERAADFDLRTTADQYLRILGVH